jgi:hypothetical protein
MAYSENGFLNSIRAEPAAKPRRSRKHDEHRAVRSARKIRQALTLALTLAPPGQHAIRAHAAWLQRMSLAVGAGHRGQVTGRGEVARCPGLLAYARTVILSAGPRQAASANACARHSLS